MRSFSAILFAAAASVALAAPAAAQSAERLSDFERPFGLGYGAAEDPIEASTRDPNGNRLIVNGRMVLGQSSLSGGLMDFDSGLGGQSMAIGNQLNVVTQGNWNTVIIDSTQINNGDVTATFEGVQQ